MPQFWGMNVWIILHAVAGTLGLICGLPVFFLSPKGPWHKRVGRVFFYSLSFSFITAMGIALVKQIPFLLVIGLFSTYFLAAGFTAIHPVGRRQNRLRNPAFWVDVFGLTVALAMLGTLPVYSQVRMRWVQGGFGLLLLVNSVQALRRPVWSLKAAKRFSRHFGGMGGAWIAACTAMLVVQSPPWPFWLVWFGPTMVLTPLLVWRGGKYVRGMMNDE